MRESRADYLSRMQTKMLKLIRRAGKRGRTDDELQVVMRLGSQTQTPRRRELVLRNRIKDSGYKRRTRKDCLATIWVAVVTPMGKGPVLMERRNDQPYTYTLVGISRKKGAVLVTKKHNALRP